MKRSQQVRVHAFLLFCVLLSTGHTVQGGGTSAVPVQVVRAVNIELAPVIWMPGTVIGRFDSKLAAEIDSRIVELAEVGDRIETGGVVARLDGTVYRLQVEEAEAGIIPIQARLEFYVREVERLEILAEQNNAAKNRLDEVQSNRNQARGELQIQKTRLDQARDRLRKTVIHAPFAGVVTDRYKTEGEWVSIGDEIIRLVNTDRLEIQARVPDTSISFIRPGVNLVVSDGRRQITAVVTTLVPVGDSLSRLYEIRLALEQDIWMTGHAVRIAIPTDAARSVVAVPRDALVIRQNNTRVFRILDDNIAEAVTVNTGIANDILIEVTGGINAGDLVVVRGNERLQPRQQVSIQQEPPPQ